MPPFGLKTIYLLTTYLTEGLALPCELSWFF